MDAILKLRFVSAWAFVQNSKFPSQGSKTAVGEESKVFVFKMSELGPGSRVDLVKRMQPSNDLGNPWIMFDHVKRVAEWTTMGCHVYDATYCRVMTIACCDLMSKDGDAQMVFWNNLNNVMRRHGIEKPEFKGFMADGAQANWNAIRAVYGGG